MADFESAVSKTLRWEGGYVNDPRDPGGETRYGISKRAYPDEDIGNLTLDRAKFLYRRDYWSKIRGDEIGDQPVAEKLFDLAVNIGVSKAVRLLQQVVGGLTVDGVMGPQTMAAVRQFAPGAGVLADRLRLAAIAYYVELSGFQTYGRGWIRRALG